MRVMWTLLLLVSPAIAPVAQEKPRLIRGEQLQIVGAQPVPGNQGMGYIDFGTTREYYDEDLGDYERKEYSFTLRRPAGADANYAVSVWYQQASVQGFDVHVPIIHTDDFYESDSSPDEYLRDGWNCVVFQPGETEKEVKFATKGYFSSHQEYERDLCAYIRFCYPNRITMEYDLLQLRFHNADTHQPDGTIGDGEALTLLSMGCIRNGYHPKAGEWLVANVEMAGVAHRWTSGLPQLRIGNDTRMVMQAGKGSVEVPPAQAVDDEVSRSLAFAYRVTDDDVAALCAGEPAGVLGITAIKGLHVTGSTQVRDCEQDSPFLIYIDTDRHGILRPRFGQMTTDKPTYAPRAQATARVEILNWQQLNAVYGTEWQECISLTADGGKTALNTQKGTLDTATGELLFTFNAASPAPGQTQCTAFVELMLTGMLLPTNDESDWPSDLRLPYLLPADAFFSYQVEGEPVVVYTESVSIQGMPDGNAIRLTGKEQQFRLHANILPADCSFLGGTWASSDPQVATVNSNGSVVLHRSGVTDITFRSSEADYRAAQGLPSADGILLSTVRLHVQEYLPDDGYAKKYFTSDDEQVLITATLDRTRLVPGSQNEWLEAWEVDADQAEVTITHQESDKYPSLHLTVPVESGYYASVAIPFDDKTFLRKRYYDPDTHGSLPTCTAVFSVPMRNKYDGEEHTYTFTYEVYHQLTNAAFGTSLADSGAVVLQDNGSGHATMRMKNLDREEGFELSFFHGVLSSDGTRIEAMAHGAKYVEKKIKPGDLDIFEGEKDLGDGVVLRMQRDRKYVEATIDYPFTMQKGETNALSAHVQNTYGMYDPRKPNWNAGENQQWVKEDPSAEWSMIEPYTQFANRFSGTSFSAIGTLSDEQWVKDNQAVYEAFVNDPSDRNYTLFTGSNLVHFYVPSLHALWGECEVIVDGKEVLKVIEAGSRGNFYLRFPFDDMPHTVTFSWPKVGLKKDFPFTAYGRDMIGRYRFRSMYCGSNKHTIADLDVNYTTSAGEKKTVTVSTTTPDQYRSYWHYFTIDEPQGIVTASITDHVDEGEEHAVLVPTTIDQPTPMLAGTSGTAVMLFDNEADAIAPTQATANFNVANLHTMDYIYLKVVDALTGEPIPNANLKTTYQNQVLEPDGMLIKVWGSGLEGAIAYSTDGKYFPCIFRNPELRRRSIIINGDEPFFDGERVLHTVALTPRADAGDVVHVEDIYLEETAPTGEGTQMVRQQYAGTSTLLPYDGSKRPGRKIRMRLLVRDPQNLDRWYDKLSLVSSQVTSGRSIGLERTAVGRKYIYRADALENGQSVSYTLLQVEGEMRDFLAPEVSGDVSLRIKGGQDYALFQMKNIDSDPSFIIDGVDFSPELPQINVGDVSRGKGLGKMQKSFDGFSIELPSSLPFTLGITHENNDYIVRGIYSHSFLPGGKIVDMLDKGDYINSFDAAFWELKRAVRGMRAQYNRDDRALTLPSASAGIKAWVEGKVGFDYETERYNFVLNSVGIAAEASAYLKAKVPFGFGSFGTSIAGEASAQASLDHPSDEDLEASKGSPLPSPFKMDLTLDFNTALSVGAYAELGIDLWVAAAKAGIRGSASASFESMAVVKPYLGKVDRGARMSLEAWLQAYATAKFLFFKKTWTGTILDKKGEWYTPNNDSNPLRLRAKDDARKVTTVLRSSVYKPLRLRQAPQNSTILLTDIDAYAQPSYLYGGKDMAYIRPKNGDVASGEVALGSGMTFAAPSAHNVFAIHTASREVGGQHTGAIAYTYSTANAPAAADSAGVAKAAANARVAVSMGNGHEWGEPLTLSDNTCSIDPKTAVSPTGNAVVAWKQGDFVPQSVDGDSTAGAIDGALMASVRRAGEWQESVALMAMDTEVQLTDYEVAMRDSVPMVLGVVGKRNADGSVRSILATATLDKKQTAQTTVTDIVASQPHLVAMKSGYFASALVVNDMGQTDVKLYRVTEAGTLADMGLLGLGNRGVIDYKLIAPESAEGIDGLAVLWKEMRKESEEDTDEGGSVRTSVYGARIARSEDGYIYLSCPQKLIDQPENLIITYYDATFADNTLTAAVTVADFDNDGANVLQSKAQFANSVRCEHVELADQVREGEDVVLSFQVFNEGYEAVDYLDINVNGRSTVKQVSILPGHSAEVTAPAPANADLAADLSFDITPYFSSAPMRVRSFASAMRRAGAQKVQANRTGMGTLKLQVTDMAVRKLAAVPDGDYVVAVTATVDNCSPMPMDASWSVKVGLYEDATGRTLYPGTTVRTVPQSQLYSQEGNNTATVGFRVTGIAKPTTLYLVAHTVDEDGNVIEDQNPSDNVTAVNLFAVKDPVGIEEPAASVLAPFTVTSQPGGLLVEGLVEGAVVRVYNPVGQLLHWYEVRPGEKSHLVPLAERGAYLVTDGKHTEKVLYAK